MSVNALVRARDEALTEPVHDDRTAAILGIALGVAFTTCFATGLYSHFLQHPPGWFTPPTRPAGLYRLTQGAHVATGFAAIPLLLAKLWSVYPRLFRWPPVTGGPHAIERLMLVPLVSGSLFMLFSGTANVARWYPWRFFFPAGHYWAAWITFGALVAHIGAKAHTARTALRRPGDDDETTASTEPAGLSRRGFLGAAAGASGFITLTTVGQTIEPLRAFVLFAPRRPDIGPQGLPVNRSAVEAGVEAAATDPGFVLRVTGAVEHDLELSVGELERRMSREAELPIACVEGWSKSARWSGISVRDLLAEAGVDGSRQVTVDVRSLEAGGLYSSSRLDNDAVRDRDTMLALALNGSRLDLDHGYPCRLIAPARPGVLQTKWVSALVVA